MSKDIKFVGYVPRWMRRYCSKLHRILAPEWSIVIKRKKTLSKNDDYWAYTCYNASYLNATIEFVNEIGDNTQGRRLVVHEFLHLFLDDVVTTSRLAGRMNKHATTRHGTKAEERTVVKMAKIIEELDSKRN